MASFSFGRLKQAVYPFTLLILSILIIFIRCPALLITPRLWAEEGAVYVVDAFHLTWFQALLNVRLGYLNIWPSLASLIAVNSVQLEFVPTITTLAAFAAQLLPVIVILINDSKIWEKPLIKLLSILVLMFIPSSNESWLSTNNSQFYFQMAVFLIAIGEVSKNPIKTWVYRVILFIGGLTGTLSIFLTPLFFYRWWKNKEKEWLIQSIILGVCGLFQAATLLFVMWQGNEVGARFSQLIGIRTMITILWSRIFGLILLGIGVDKKLLPYLYPLVQLKLLRILTPILLLVIEVVLLWWSSKNFQWEKKIIWLGGFFLCFFASVFFALGHAKSLLIHPGYSTRYFLIPTAIIMLMILMNFHLEKNRWQKKIYLIAVILPLMWGVYSFINESVYSKDWPVWQQQVAHWRDDPAYRLEIAPPGWNLSLESPGQ